MRLTPGTKVTVKLDGNEQRFTLVSSSGGNGRLNIKAPLAVLLGGMAAGNTIKAWTPCVAGAGPMRVELVAIVS